MRIICEYFGGHQPIQVDGEDALFNRVKLEVCARRDQVIRDTLPPLPAKLEAH